jgi:hypothetical protein
MYMNSNLRKVLLPCIALLLTSIPAIAHHSVQAEFTINKKTTMTGVITKIDWINPHSYFYFESKDANGNVEKWTGESYPTGFFHRAGITRTTFTVGDTVTVVMYLAKDGTKNYGWIHTMKLPSGRMITFDNNDEPSNE